MNVGMYLSGWRTTSAGPLPHKNSIVPDVPETIVTELAVSVPQLVFTRAELVLLIAD